MTQYINLYDPALRRKREWLSAASLAAVAGGLFLVVLAWGIWAQMRYTRLQAEQAPVNAELTTLQAQVQALGKEIGSMKPDPALATSLEMAKARLALREHAVDLLGKGLGAEAVPFGDYLRALARQTPGGIWLTGFAVDADGADMALKGRTTDPALLSGYIRRLNTEKAFQGRSFSVLRMSAGALDSPETAVPATVSAPAGASSGARGSGTAGATQAILPFHEFLLASGTAADNADGKVKGATQ
ncbi:MAG: PilN domain-containing protein [Proteobacteria bacterium]|nr:PilN domain-containing protein [Pseudomonadota bacterium]HQR04200.1 PilN domain-containing protein [Rhodocyclaceae bacterium]